MYYIYPPSCLFLAQLSRSTKLLLVLIISIIFIVHTYIGHTATSLTLRTMFYSGVPCCHSLGDDAQRGNITHVCQQHTVRRCLLREVQFHQHAVTRFLFLLVCRVHVRRCTDVPSECHAPFPISHIWLIWRFSLHQHTWYCAIPCNALSMLSI